MIKITDVIRWIISIGLLIGSYFETGTCTVILLALVVIGSEFLEFARRIINKDNLF